MESAALTAHVARSHVAVHSTRPLPRGRFSTGIEQRPDAPANQRIGHFCDGIAQVPESSGELRVGRFSTGVEHAETPSTRRVGSFADGYRSLGGR